MSQFFVFHKIVSISAVFYDLDDPMSVLDRVLANDKAPAPQQLQA